jgi:hypothetical protein
MTFSADELNIMIAVLQAPTDSFAALVRISGLNPARDLRNADLRNINFRTDDLSGFDFGGSLLLGADFSKVSGLTYTMFIDAEYDFSTKWPPGFKLDRLPSTAAETGSSRTVRQPPRKRVPSQYEILWNECASAVIRFANTTATRYRASMLGRTDDELEPTALIQSAWLRLLEHPPVAITTADELAKVFVALISGRAAHLARQPTSIDRFNMLTIVPTESSTEGTISADDVGQGPGNPEDALILQDFADFVADRDPQLVPLMEAILRGTVQPAEQAVAVGGTLADVYRLRAQLKRRLSEYLSTSTSARTSSSGGRSTQQSGSAGPATLRAGHLFVDRP